MIKGKPKIIIWGYNQDNHTQYYIHWAWHRAFKHLGYDTYWFSDEDHPTDFDYENCLFIAEGYRDNNIPLVKSSTYFVNFLINPSKYVNSGVRAIDIKLNVNQINDCNYNYNLDKSKVLNIGNCAYYESESSDDDDDAEEAKAKEKKRQERKELLDRLAAEYEKEAEKAKAAADSGEGCLMCSG